MNDLKKTKHELEIIVDQHKHKIHELEKALAEKNTIIERLTAIKNGLEHEREALKRDLAAMKNDIGKWKDMEKTLRLEITTHSSKVVTIEKVRNS